MAARTAASAQGWFLASVTLYAPLLRSLFRLFVRPSVCLSVCLSVTRLSCE